MASQTLQAFPSCQLAQWWFHQGNVGTAGKAQQRKGLPFLAPACFAFVVFSAAAGPPACRRRFSDMAATAGCSLQTSCLSHAPASFPGPGGSSCGLRGSRRGFPGQLVGSLAGQFSSHFWNPPSIQAQSPREATPSSAKCGPNGQAARSPCCTEDTRRGLWLINMSRMKYTVSRPRIVPALNNSKRAGGPEPSEPAQWR